MTATKWAHSLIAGLRSWSVPRIASEKELDQSLLKFIRRQVAQRVPALQSNRLELKRWVAGHRGPERHKKFWTATKRHQTVCLWGATKTSDLFVYHPEGKYGLPRRGISFEVKYVPRGDSYANAIATVAGQLLAYSLRHARTIGFVFAEQRRPHKARPVDMHRDRYRQLLRRLPANATLMVRFRRE